ncbi:phage tail protein I [Enterobacter hormaechei]|nr:phage tail protein I [Enterobacter hormaechei]
MNDTRLLPVGSSPLEVAAARACAEIENTPVPLRRLWSPDDCPANLLPWLAWAFSVDRWDESWPEATKREVIRAAWFIRPDAATVAEQTQKQLIEDAGLTISVLQGAVDESMATDAEKASLSAWKRYRVLLYRVDTSKPEDIVWPEPPSKN